MLLSQELGKVPLFLFPFQYFEFVVFVHNSPVFLFLVFDIFKFTGASFDPELRSVLELATDSELFELENILFGPR